jgi:hypothetical protein
LVRWCSALKWDDIYRVWDQVSTLLSIPLALVGFGVTIWQLVKTKNAAEAARGSAESAMRQIRRVSLASLLPQLHRIEDEIDRAVRADSVDLLLAWLSIWRWQAGELRGHLDSKIPAERKIMKSIQASMTIAAEVKGQIIDKRDGSLGVVTVGLRGAIASATKELGSLAAAREFDVKELEIGK